MNYLAHAYLSFEDPEILVGNMISDFVKGKKKFGYAPGIQQGIALHRSIDNFTDFHIANIEAKKVFKPTARLYAGAFVDIAYDHFLAMDQNELSELEWMNFTTRTYKNLFKYKNVLPEKFSYMLPFMSEQDWLFNYRYFSGIEKSFEGLTRRAAYLQNSKPVFEAFQNEYDVLKQCYIEFFPSLKNFALNLFNQFR